ncbi:hypothetical protein [Streptomyces sp. NBC_01565]|uniref:hypothetical protein n=1 Tax=unclassified Streptomyces TaxID=2593676 RepID=UPI00224D6BDA|nr:hypothetical protein [Streptomyces sp. NBC_01565]MCX4546891.1 hypothetical protein [Streptomyces sp. NBC_01565]
MLGDHPLYQTWPLDRLLDNRAIGKFYLGDRDGVVDAAVAELDAGTKWSADILGIGSLTGTYTIKQEDADTHCFEVRKRGIAIGRTGGTVQAVNASHHIDGTYLSSDCACAASNTGSLLACPSMLSRAVRVVWSLWVPRMLCGPL